MDGILLIDKPRGMTSHDVVATLRKLLKMKRIGHGGTLDPDATGLLTICLGKATKVSNLLSQCDKVYEVAFTLGLETDTYDSTGEVKAERPVAIDRDGVEQSIRKFIGVLEQKPPIYSAIKIKGRKLYEYARSGEPVEIPSRSVTIFSIELESYVCPHGKMEVVCSKGTYIRSLVHDLGQELATGAVTTAIRRIQSGFMRLSEALSLEQISKAENPERVVLDRLIPISRALMGIPTLQVSDEMLPRILQGAGLRPRDMASCRWNALPGGPMEPVLVLGNQGEAIALGAYDGHDSLQVRRVL